MLRSRKPVTCTVLVASSSATGCTLARWYCRSPLEATPTSPSLCNRYLVPSENTSFVRTVVTSPWCVSNGLTEIYCYRTKSFTWSLADSGNRTHYLLVPLKKSTTVTQNDWVVFGQYTWSKTFPWIWLGNSTEPFIESLWVDREQYKSLRLNNLW